MIGTTRGLMSVATSARCERRPRAHLPSVNTCAPPGPAAPPIRANEGGDRQRGNAFAHRRAGLGKVSRDRRLPERECVRLCAGLEERHLKRPLADRVVLAHELVQATVPEQPVPVLVDVDAV